MTTLAAPLISTHDLSARLGAADLRLIDASWWLDGRDARADFERERLPGAVFFDLDAVSDRNSPYPHMLPTPQAFAEAMEAMGVTDADDIVVYDAQGLFSAARVWWTLRVMGARRVRVLDGGLPKWKREGRPLDSGSRAVPAKAIFATSFNPAAVADFTQVQRALAEGQQVADARGGPRFRGEVSEPRPGLRSGHMPGARNLPYPALLNANGTLKDGPALAAAFQDAGVDIDQPVVTTCGSGVTAAVLTLALAVLGREARLYDGSWAEWGAREDAPVAKGAT